MTTDIGHWQSRVREEFRFWLKENPEGTLGDLKDWLEQAHEQCSEFCDSDDPVIEVTDDIPWPLCEYLDWWEDHDGESFSFRAANLEEDCGNVAEVIGELGEQTRLDSLPLREVSQMLDTNLAKS